MLVAINLRLMQKGFKNNLDPFDFLEIFPLCLFPCPLPLPPCALPLFFPCPSSLVPRPLPFPHPSSSPENILPIKSLNSIFSERIFLLINEYALNP